MSGTEKNREFSKKKSNNEDDYDDDGDDCDNEIG